MSARVIAMSNQKGGVAKTTSVASLGAALAELGRRVLLVDLDPQACLTFSLGIDPEALEMSVHDVMLGRVSAGMIVRPTEDGPDILPATIELAGTEGELMSRPGREFTLGEALDELRERYDEIILDCAPSLGVLTVNALTAADLVIIPLQCETLSHRGVGQLLDTIELVKRRTNPRLEVLGVLPTLYDGRTTHAREVLADIASRYGLPVLSPPIPKSVRFAEAPMKGRSVLKTTPRGAGSEAYREHARNLIAGTIQQWSPRADGGSRLMAEKKTAGFDRIRPRTEGAASAGPRPDPQGRQALFTESPDVPAMGAVTVTCSSCEQTSALNLRQAAFALLPSAHLPLLRKDHPSFLRCPACKKMTWVKVGLQI